MRVLCLHGMGTNAGIFETQTEIFRNLLPKHLDFEFFDADHEIEAADGVGDIFPGPYTCWYPVPTNTNVQDAHHFVWDVIEQEGPFDAVMGFSQGAALAASVILTHRIEHPREPAPFKLAVFICGSLPYCLDDKRGVDVASLFAQYSPSGEVDFIKYRPTSDDGSARARPLLQQTQTTRSNDGRSIADLVDAFDNLWLKEVKKDDTTLSIVPVSPSAFDSEPASPTDSDSAIFSPTSGYSTPLTPSSNIGDEGSWSPKRPSTTDLSSPVTIRRFHADVDKIRIEIPTAHIYGRTDPYNRQSKELERLCDPKWATAYEHPEGHVVPRNPVVNDCIAACVERAMAAVEICGR
ncbi:uncharacterized protein Z518_00497 [Rhinocladiella mackenziei CBS 650.93]|uniref:Serine hydrolase domain-containing protein n=1 Tax=Rhinocladiella mackenziei CBS 650.93 TaxID=1442369 RepID=A0A0D2G439_9EURO|nr:uncharacterized protein Z518_00497 [Rhinocladiella mackenziei CBS 650.93]KIX09417.1 hypothetical protein Z518_00497 [Rhinocladiella mackenziei CBS 650.93]